MRLIACLIFTLCFINLKAQDTMFVKTEDVNIECFEINKENRGIIKNSEELKKYAHHSRSTTPQCSSYSLPEFDFNTNDLIWIDEFISGCTIPKVVTKYYRINSQKKYLFVVEIHIKDTNCKAIRPVFVRKMAPKTENDFSFEYLIKYVSK